MIKRAWLYLTRKYKRSILLFFLLFVISFSIAVALSIWNSINAVTREVERSLGTSITLKLSSATQTEGFYQDHTIDVVYKNGNSYKCYNGPPLADDTIRQVLEGVDGFTSYNADDDTYGHLDGLKLIPGLWDSSIRKELWGERLHSHPAERGQNHRGGDHRQGYQDCGRGQVCVLLPRDGKSHERILS